MSDQRETIVNVAQEPTRTVFVSGAGGGGVLAGVIIAALLIGVAAFFYLRPADTLAPASTNITIEAPSPPAQLPAPQREERERARPPALDAPAAAPGQ